MKADEPAAKLSKYGMTAEHSDRIVACHVALIDEEQLIAGGALAHNLRVADIVHAKLNGKLAVAAPVATPEAEPTPPAVPPIVVITERARPDNLRERLGLR